MKKRVARPVQPENIDYEGQMLRNLVGIIVVSAHIMYGSSVDADVVLDFEQLEHVDAFVDVPPGLTYSEDGYTLTTPGLGGFASFGTLDSRFTGSTSLIINSLPNPLDLQDPRNSAILTRDGGGSFALRSIDLAELNFHLSTTVTFVATKSGGGTATQSFTIDGIGFAAETFFFSTEFESITSVTWRQEGNFHQFDNIVVGPAGPIVPEPSTMLLFSSGLIGLAFSRRRLSSAKPKHGRKHR
ncbi:PEP-CTERM motif protein [Thalassoglobus neptunius]|uniref:PEP-CTERM motif protein n=1 Tax=Thalassoglobus neptunius TaxID=1938619 RepID=A0A5C5X385_9PLAN|nr:PEP-CTERM sorting domain-containing protein [Thalassoglobus neptunius]TWT57416.1 PEP-CTERM motif protein [Thalassoglobus neptunius]